MLSNTIFSLPLLALLFGLVTYTIIAKSHNYVIGTGGGIAGMMTGSTSSTKWTSGKLDIDSVLSTIDSSFLKDEQGKQVDLKSRELALIKSQNMRDPLLIKLSRSVNRLIKNKDCKGIVVTHGTDTIEETAYFLNLLIKSKKPVVLLGAVRPFNHPSPDGPLNLRNALVLANSKKAWGKGVLVCMDGMILLARGAQKIHTFSTGSIKHQDSGFSGYVYGNRVYFYHESTRKHTFNSVFTVAADTTLPKVAIIYGHSGISQETYQNLLEANIQGLVYAGVGNGNIHEDLFPLLVKAQKKGITVVRASRYAAGPVTRDTEVDDDHEQLQTIVSDNLSPQKARLLLMLGLSKTKRKKTLQTYFDTY